MLHFSSIFILLFFWNSYCADTRTSFSISYLSCFLFLLLGEFLNLVFLIYGFILNENFLLLDHLLCCLTYYSGNFYTWSCISLMLLPSKDRIYVCPPLESGLGHVTFLANGIFTNVMQLNLEKPLFNRTFPILTAMMWISPARVWRYMIQLKASISTKHVSEAILDHLFLLQPSPAVRPATLPSRPQPEPLT